MSEQLQDISYMKSLYERPNQKWVCGKKSTGKPCLEGPDDRGRCQATFECSPRKEDDRWFCTRSQFLGGPCSQGPSPDGTCCRPVQKCQPIRSWRSWRGVVTLSIAVLTLAIVALILTLDGGTDLISPGALSTGHAGLEEECGTCHVSFNTGFSGWVISAFSGSIRAENSHRCQSCHNLGGHAMEPHSLSAERIEALRTEQKAGLESGPQMHNSIGGGLTVSLSRLLVSESPDLSCDICHKEHKGAGRNTTGISQERCLSCHQDQFYSLSNGHPDFVNYPSSRRTRIIFDHVSHLEKHFKEDKYSDKAPMGCGACHFPEVDGTKMVVYGYEYSCAACHQSQVSGYSLSGSKGVEVLGVPGLDIDVLKEKGIDIGEWPEEPYWTEDELSPFMKLLLSARPEFSKIEEVIQDLDLLLDLSDATDEQLEQVKNLAWIVKELFYELEIKGATALMENIRDSLKNELRNSTLIGLAAALPPDLIQSARQHWFPGLLREIPLYRNGESIQITVLTGQVDEQGTAGGETSDDDFSEEASEDAISSEDRASSGGWYREEYQLRYRPVLHADQFMKTWLDVSSQSSTAHGFRLFEFLERKNAPGACIKCHSIDKTTEKRLIVNWKIPVTDPNEHTFAKFSHTSHYSQLDEKACFTCHKIDKEADYAAVFDSRDFHDFASNFQPISRKICVKCHLPDQAGDSCVNCHNYHIGKFPPAEIHPKTFAHNING